mgnify:CR=1 FL=1
MTHDNDDRNPYVADLTEDQLKDLRTETKEIWEFFGSPETSSPNLTMGLLTLLNNVTDLIEQKKNLEYVMQLKGDFFTPSAKEGMSEKMKQLSVALTLYSERL